MGAKKQKKEKKPETRASSLSKALGHVSRDSGSAASIFEEIKSIEANLKDSDSRLNDILRLISLLSAKGVSRNGTGAASRIQFCALNALLRIFVCKAPIMTRQAVASQDKVVSKVANWLRKQRARYNERIQELLLHSEDAIRIAALRAILLMTAKRANDMPAPTCDKVFGGTAFCDAISTVMISCIWSIGFAHEVTSTLLTHSDLRYQILSFIVNTLFEKYGRVPEGAVMLHNCVTLLESLLESNGGSLYLEQNSSFKFSQSHPVKSQHGQKAMFSHFVQALCNCLSVQANVKELHKRILRIAPEKIFPKVSDPRLLMSYFNACYDDCGGSLSLLALHSVLVLITKHNLDYPDFFTKLYCLFDSNVLHLKQRSRFFKLFELFMNSSSIPTYLAAAFIKRMARLALSAPPAAVMLVIPVIYNLLKKHPQCIKLIHRVDANSMRDDPFIMSERNPQDSRALDSSLWELLDLQRHYFPNVATLAAIFKTKLSRDGYDIDDFINYSYDSLFETVYVEKMKKVPPFNHLIPNELFSISKESKGAAENVPMQLFADYST